jgi:hypothetical protein
MVGLLLLTYVDAYTVYKAPDERNINQSVN